MSDANIDKLWADVHEARQRQIDANVRLRIAAFDMEGYATAKEEVQAATAALATAKDAVLEALKAKFPVN